MGSGSRLPVPKAAWLALILLQLGFAAFFFRERIVFDAGYYLMRTVCAGGFYTEHGRVVLILAEVLPWVGLKLGLPLWSLILLYSLNHAAVPAAIGWGLYRRTGSMVPALFLALAPVLGVHVGYWVPQFEGFYAAWLLFPVAVWCGEDRRAGPLWTAVALIALAGAVLGYEATVFSAAYLIVAGALHRRRWGRAVAVLVGIGLLVGARQLFLSDYEAAVQTAMRAALMEQGLPPKGVLLHFAAHFPTQYWEATILFLWALAGMVRARAWALLALTAAVFCTIAWTVLLRAPEASVNRFNQQIYYPLAVFVLYALYAAHRLRLQGGRAALPPVVTAWMLVVLTITSLLRIAAEGPGVRHRRQALEACIAAVHAAGRDKVTIDAEEFKQRAGAGRFDAEWSLPIEAMLLSAARGGPQRAVSLVSAEDGTLPAGGVRSSFRNHFLFRPKEIFPHTFLPPRYFSLQDTAYTPLPR